MKKRKSSLAPIVIPGLIALGALIVLKANEKGHEPEHLFNEEDEHQHIPCIRNVLLDEKDVHSSHAGKLVCIERRKKAKEEGEPLHKKQALQRE